MKRPIIFINRSPYFRRTSFITLVSTLAEFSFTKWGGDAITWVISIPGTWVVMTVVVLDPVLLLVCAALFDVPLDISRFTAIYNFFFIYKMHFLDLLLLTR
jgi:hypothetical protein